MMGFVSRPRLGKYNSKSAAYGGHLYHSLKEARYACELDIRVRSGELKSWKRQVPFVLCVNGDKLGRYYLDFLVEYPDGTLQAVEVKGYPAPLGEWKLKHFKAQHPELDLQVIR
jgi:hypothetical protein